MPASPSAQTADGDEALFEMGVGGVGAWLPDYPASDENHPRGIGFPFFIYRGDVFEVGERGGVRGFLLDNDLFELDLSARAAFDADAKDNEARRGMDDLDFLVEVGPSLGFKLYEPIEDRGLSLELQLRGVLSANIPVGFEGFLFNPAVRWRQNAGFLGEVDLRAGVLFADDRLQDYFYEVPLKDALPGRPPFDADAGYLGSEAALVVRTPLGTRARVSNGLRLGFYGGAANEGSPLHRDDFSVGFVSALILTLYRSDARARR